jgi:ABC-type Fe3+-hydroxamate transport system substrate-binding protein
VSVLVDASGCARAVGAPAQRIVSLVPSATELLCALGLADALVGVTAYCVEPPEVVRRRVRVGGEKDPDLDAIRALAPDLVVANVEENRREDVEALRGAGIPVWVTYPRSVADGLRMIGELGAVTGTSAAAGALLAELEPLAARVRVEAAARSPVAVFYPIWRGPYMTINRDTYVSDVIAVCGGRNVFADEPARYPVVTLDEMARRRPDVILLPDEPFRFRRAHLADFAPHRDVPAVRDGRILLVDGKRFSWHGPRLAEALRTVPAMLGAGPAGR